MSRKSIYGVVIFAIFVVITWNLADADTEPKDFPNNVKVALRDVGNQLLLTDKDSTSLVYPVVELERYKYQLSFEQELSMVPDSLVAVVERSFQKAKLPLDYRIEVLQCADQEVAYSYRVSAQQDFTIIPCRGRVVPLNCYIIEASFIKKETSFLSNGELLYLPIIGILIFIGFQFFKKNQDLKQEENNTTYAAIGSFKFYPEQNKLVKEAVEIGLSKKECELLAIFVANPNQIIKRDELSKRVWEDNGVVVGRSLDTYISKLRKKLQDDEAIKLTNVHGVGYKLEIGK